MSGDGLEIALTTDVFDDAKNAKGVANYIRFLSANLPNLGSEHSFETVHFTRSEAEPYQHGLSDLVIEPYPLPGTGFQRLVTNRFRGRKALEGADIFHATAPRLHYLPLMGGDYGTVMTVHSLDLYIPENMRASLFSEPHAWIQQTLFGSYFELVREEIDAIITVSEASKNDIIKNMGVPAEKVHQVHLAAADRFREVQIQSDRSFILSDTPEPALIEMFRRLIDAGFEQDLIVFSMRGYGYDRAIRLVENYGLDERVKFRGYVTDENLVKLYNTADVYVRFAGHEGFGLPPLEAMACGCPVVTTNVGSLPEVVADAGILLDMEDIDGFVDEVSQLLSDAEFREAMVSAGFKRSSSFSWERTARETVEVYESITAYNDR